MEHSACSSEGRMAAFGSTGISLRRVLAAPGYDALCLPGAYDRGRGISCGLLCVCSCLLVGTPVAGPARGSSWRFLSWEMRKSI